LKRVEVKSTRWCPGEHEGGRKLAFQDGGGTELAKWCLKKTQVGEKNLPDRWTTPPALTHKGKKGEGRDSLPVRRYLTGTGERDVAGWGKLGLQKKREKNGLLKRGGMEKKRNRRKIQGDLGDPSTIWGPERDHSNLAIRVRSRAGSTRQEAGGIRR